MKNRAKCWKKVLKPYGFKGTEKGMLFTTEEHTFFKVEQKSGKNQQEIKKPGNYPGIIATILFIFTTIAVK